jgi:hypothetical protein
MSSQFVVKATAKSNQTIITALREALKVKSEFKRKIKNGK